MPVPTKDKERRRSKRLPVQIPVILRGNDAAGRGFFDRAELVSVAAHGARMRTRFELAVGTEVEVLMPDQNTTKRLRVVWRGDVGGFEEGLVGVELADPKDRWDIEELNNP